MSPKGKKGRPAPAKGGHTPASSEKDTISAAPEKAGRDTSQAASGPEQKNRERQATRTSRPTANFPVVGIGASAGGLAALTNFLKYRPVSHIATTLCHDTMEEDASRCSTPCAPR